VIIGDVGYTVVEGFLGDLAPVKRPPRTTTTTAGDDPFRQQPTDVHLVAPARPATAAPAAVDLPPPPAPVRPLSEAEALSQLFLQTVREK
jgi:hypothetical protein